MIKHKFGSTFNLLTSTDSSMFASLKGRKQGLKISYCMHRMLTSADVCSQLGQSLLEFPELVHLIDWMMLWIETLDIVQLQNYA